MKITKPEQNPEYFAIECDVPEEYKVTRGHWNAFSYMENHNGAWNVNAFVAYRHSGISSAGAGKGILHLTGIGPSNKKLRGGIYIPEKTFLQLALLYIHELSALDHTIAKNIEDVLVNHVAELLDDDEVPDKMVSQIAEDLLNCVFLE
jgi:hypothetical protein